MKIILSSGLGPLHFVSSAESISRQVDELAFICGYVPRSQDSLLLKIAAWLRGKSLKAGITKRKVDAHNYTCVNCFFSELFNQVLLVLGRFFPGFYMHIVHFPWRVFGWQSKKYIAGGDVLHVRSGAGHGGAIRRARRMGMKVVVDHSIAHPRFMDDNMRSEYERNGVRFDMGMRNSFWKMIDEDCRMADIVQVNSSFVKDTFIAAGYQPDKIRVVQLGVRKDFWGLRNPKFDKEEKSTIPLKLLFTGGFGFRKGAEYILEAARLIKEAGVCYEFDVVGDCSSAARLIEAYGKYGLPIVFHGQMPQDELKQFLANGDIYIFPSLAEGCAQSGMEAMAAGMCVVGTHESGFPITDGKDGYIVPSKDAKAIADKVIWLDAHRAMIDSIGHNAAELVRERYSWEKYAENTLKIYEEILRM